MSDKTSKNLWHLLSKIDRRSLIMLSVALVLIIYSTTYKEKYDEIPTRRMIGILNSTPYIEKTGGDFTYYSLIININEYEDKFTVSGCAFKALDKTKIELLEKGEEIILFVEKSHSYKVLGMEYKNLKLINEKRSSSCHDSSWIKNLILFVVALAIICFDIIRIYGKS